MNAKKNPDSPEAQLRHLLSRNDWGEILVLLEKKAYQRKFQIIEAFTELVAEKGFDRLNHSEIAARCGITRQLVDHHFPSEAALVTLAYRYIYAGFQKTAVDALVTRSGFINQLNAYIHAVANWATDKRSHARFLVKFYALLQLNAEFAAIQERNLRIGQERITALCIAARSEGLFKNIPDEVLARNVSSVQIYILGFLVMHSWKDSISTESKEQLWRATLALLEIPIRSTK